MCSELENQCEEDQYGAYLDLYGELLYLDGE